MERKPRQKAKRHVDPHKVNKNIHLTREDATFGKRGYKEVKRLLILQPNRILKIFNNCHTEGTKQHPMYDDPCHIWTHTTHEGKLALINNQPRFGAGKLAPAPANTFYARRYIYLTKYPWMEPQITGRGSNHITTPCCEPYCVNPNHMWPRPTKKPKPND